MDVNKIVLIDRLIDVLMDVRNIIQKTESNMVWSSYNSEDELLRILDNHMVRLITVDFSKVDELVSLFLPTSDLQEISISSGWGDEYLILADRFDKAIKDVIKGFNLNIR